MYFFIFQPEDTLNRSLMHTLCEFDTMSINQKPANIFSQNFAHMFTSHLGKI